MEYCLGYLPTLLIAGITIHFLLTLLKRTKLNPKRRPPGPFPLPIIGNLLSFGTQPHRSMAKLAETYGPVLSLQVGSRTVVVFSSVAMAKEVLQTNDVAFANRTIPEALTVWDHHLSSIALRPADARWRTFRKICITQVFANTRLDATLHLRRIKVDQLLSYIQTCCDAGKPVNVGQAAFTTSLNFLSNTFFSIDLADPKADSELAREFKELATNLISESGTPNLADFFPVFRALDPQGIKKRVHIIIGKILSIFDQIINERLELRRSSPAGSVKHNDVLNAMLDLAEESKDVSVSDVRHLLLDLFVAGTDSTSSATEWAMTEMLRHPDQMKRAQAELREVVGEGNLVEEQDSARLPYLQAIVKENFRVHTPTPFLIMRKVSQDVKVGNYTVPKDAQVLVNVWAIGKDPSLWANPESFEPERFLGSPIEFKGQNFELIPFGSGRRICPGIPLANRMVHWMLASLLHSFDWKFQDGVDTPETVDMDEKFGFNLHKAKPLYAVPLPKQY